MLGGCSEVPFFPATRYEVELLSLRPRVPGHQQLLRIYGTVIVAVDVAQFLIELRDGFSRSVVLVPAALVVGRQIDDRYHDIDALHSVRLGRSSYATVSSHPLCKIPFGRSSIAYEKSIGYVHVTE